MADPHTHKLSCLGICRLEYISRSIVYANNIYVYRENVIGRPNAFADLNALSVYTVEHERY